LLRCGRWSTNVFQPMIEHFGLESSRRLSQEVQASTKIEYHDMYDVKRPRAWISSDAFRSTPTGHTSQDAGIDFGSCTRHCRAASREEGGISIEVRQIIRIDQVLHIGLVTTITTSSIHQLHIIIRRTTAMRSTITTTIKRNVSSLKCTPAAVRYASCKPLSRTVCEHRPCQLITMTYFVLAFSKFDWEVGESILC
jgi:hypothetical protein